MSDPRRMFWTLLSPFVWCAHRFGWCSYKWVNVCLGARRPNGFGALWQHEWYGAPVAELPDVVSLSGVPYRTGYSEGTVTFRDDSGMGASRITFDRDAISRQALWYVTLSGTTAAPHVDAAYRWVRAVFGGSHVWRATP